MNYDVLLVKTTDREIRRGGREAHANSRATLYGPENGPGGDVS